MQVMGDGETDGAKLPTVGPPMSPCPPPKTTYAKPVGLHRLMDIFFAKVTEEMNKSSGLLIPGSNQGFSCCGFLILVFYLPGRAGLQPPAVPQKKKRRKLGSLQLSKCRKRGSNKCRQKARQGRQPDWLPLCNPIRAYSLFGGLFLLDAQYFCAGSV